MMSAMVRACRRRLPAPLGCTLLAVVLAAASVCAKPVVRPSGAAQFRLRVLHSYPHDSRAYTQGLLVADGKLYESTGLYGRSSLRRVDLASGVVEAQVSLAPELFGEGLARVGGRLIQLTWKNGKAIVWDLDTLAQVAEFTYPGEGWGLCFDGARPVMSDGSDRLTIRDPSTFAARGALLVRLNGKPLLHLNELECGGRSIYANVWQDDHFARIDAITGEVNAWVDAGGLLDRDEAAAADVLNGIAELEPTGHLLITGKLWPALYEVELVPAAQDPWK